MACGIGGVDDTPPAVSAFTCEVVLVFSVIASKGNALLDEPFDAFPPVLDGETHGIFMTQVSAGCQRILNMFLDAVFVIEHCRDAALRPQC